MTVAIKYSWSVDQIYGPWINCTEEKDVLMRLAWKAVLRINKTLAQADHYWFPLEIANAMKKEGNGTIYDIDVVFGETVQKSVGYYEKRIHDLRKDEDLKLCPDSPKHLWKIRAWIEAVPKERDTIQWMEPFNAAEKTQIPLFYRDPPVEKKQEKSGPPMVPFPHF